MTTESVSVSKNAYLLIAVPLIFAITLLVVPFGNLVLLSFWSQVDLDIDKTFTLANYLKLFSNPTYYLLLLKTIKIAALVTFLTIFLAYPVAYYIAFHVKGNKSLWLIIVTAPFWTSYLLRVFSWKIILGYNGALNSALIQFGLISEPFESILYNPTAVVITLTHAWAAIAILPIYTSLEKVDKTLLEASSDLGENAIMSFLRVTLPLSMPGVIAASLLIFIPIMGDYVTPALVGGASGQMIGNFVQSMFGRANNWPLGASVSIISMISTTFIVVVYLQIFSRFGGKNNATK